MKFNVTYFKLNFMKIIKKIDVDQDREECGPK